MATKSAVKSTSVWGGAIAFFLSAGSFIHTINIIGLAQAVAENWPVLVTAFASVLAVWGRIRASVFIAPADPLKASNSSKMFPLLVAALLPAFMFGTVATAPLLLTSCATIDVGADPVVVNAERTTALAVDTFDSFLKFEYSNRAGVAAVSADVHAYAEVIRRNGQGWLQNARLLTRAYKANRTAENKANLTTAISVLQSAITISQQYLTKGTH